MIAWTNAGIDVPSRSTIGSSGRLPDTVSGFRRSPGIQDFAAAPRILRKLECDEHRMGQTANACGVRSLPHWQNRLARNTISGPAGLHRKRESISTSDDRVRRAGRQSLDRAPNRLEHQKICTHRTPYHIVRIQPDGSTHRRRPTLHAERHEALAKITSPETVEFDRSRVTEQAAEAAQPGAVGCLVAGGLGLGGR